MSELIVPKRRHASMPMRLQETPYGSVRLNSFWHRDRYLLTATGSVPALRWLFPGREGEPDRIAIDSYRWRFQPAPQPITVERELRKICAAWMDQWDERLHDGHVEDAPADEPYGIRNLGDLVRVYSAMRQSELSLNTKEKHRYAAQIWFHILGADTPLVSLTEPLLVRERDKLLQSSTSSTVNSRLGYLKQILNWAELRSIPVSPGYKLVKKVPETKRDTKAWWTTPEVAIAIEMAGQVDEAEYRLALGSARRRKGDVVERHSTATLLIALGCFLGLRWEEMIMLRWDDIDLDRIDNQSGDPAPIVTIRARQEWSPKDGESRTIPVHTQLLGILQEHRRESGWLLQPYKSIRKRGGTKRVYRYDPQKVWRRVLTKAMARGVKKISPHGMRHSFASNLLMAGVSVV